MMDRGGLRLILASGSPRRRELLSTAGLKHEVIVSGADEDVEESNPRRLVEKLSAKKAQEVYQRILKERTIQSEEIQSDADRSGETQSDADRSGEIQSDADRSGEIQSGEDQNREIQSGESQSSEESFAVLGADTVVAMDGVILGKPQDEEDAARMLRMLSGRSHHVCTGVTLHGMVDGKECIRTFSEESTVHVESLTEEEIAEYIATKEPMDKAGAYGIQGAFMKFVKGIEGDYFNIVGLPVHRVYLELKAFCSNECAEESRWK